MVVVRGRSMEPTLRDGDRLLVVHGARPRTGRLAVARLAGVVAVKRVALRDDQGWWLERDNPVEGIDSWSAGPVSDDDIVARVLFRWWPPRRIVRRRSMPGE